MTVESRNYMHDERGNMLGEDDLSKLDQPLSLGELRVATVGWELQRMRSLLCSLLLFGPSLRE